MYIVKGIIISNKLFITINNGKENILFLNTFFRNQ